jgi:methylamine utilization protein MauE
MGPDRCVVPRGLRRGRRAHRRSNGDGTMNIAAGPFTIVALLLVVGGLSKVLDPGDTAAALRGVGIPLGRVVVRIGAAAELLVGAYAAVVGDRVGAALVACSYAAFAAFVTIALVRRVPIATCGCFGKADTPPSVVHVVLDLAAIVAAISVVVDPGVGLRDALSRQPLDGVPYLVLVVTGAYLAMLSLTALPRAMALVREVRAL